MLEMRYQELLREVRNDKPSANSNLDRIMAITKTSVVLESAFRVSDVIVSDGRLLLITARSGWTPTVTGEVENCIRNNLDGPYV